MGGLSIGGGAVTHDELNVYSSGTKMGGLWGTGSGGYGKFNLRDNGTEKLLLSAGSDSYFNGGDVAIGTSSPDHKFHVSGSIASNTTEEVCRIEGGTWVNSGGITIKATGANTGATRLTTIFSIDNQDQNSPLAFGTGTTERMRITSTGLVGIGTASPAKPLHISSADNQPLRVESTDAYSGIEIKDNGSSTLPPLISALSDDFIFYGGQ